MSGKYAVKDNQNKKESAKLAPKYGPDEGASTQESITKMTDKYYLPGHKTASRLRQDNIRMIQQMLGNRISNQIIQQQRKKPRTPIKHQVLSPFAVQRQRDEQTERWARLDWIYLEDFFRLYSNSRGHEAKTPRLQSQGTSWDRLWPQDWVERNDSSLLSRIRRRLRHVQESNRLSLLEWYVRFLSEIMVDAQRTEARDRLLQEVRSMIGGQSSEEHAQEARLTLRVSFRRFALGSAKDRATHRGNQTDQTAAYSTLLRTFRRAVADLSGGGEASMSPGARGMTRPEARAISPEHIGVGAGQQAWDALEEHQRQVILRNVNHQMRLREALNVEYCLLIRRFVRDEEMRVTQEMVDNLCALGDPNFSASPF